MTVHVLPKWIANYYSCPEVNTVSSSGESIRELSPFILGPIETYIPGVYSKNFENLWQFSKVYKEFAYNSEPTDGWYRWRNEGWLNDRAVRYPMRRGAIPLYSWWDGRKLGYIDARKQIYAPIYAKYVSKTVAYELLEDLYKEHGEVTLKDYDAYDHIKMGMTLKDVINNPNRKMGHAFVLAMMLEGVLEECLK